MKRQRYSLDKAREVLDEVYERGFEDGRAQAIEALHAESQCGDNAETHDPHVWNDWDKHAAWCPGFRLIAMEF